MKQTDFDWILDDIDPMAGLSPTLQDPDKNDLGEQKKARFGDTCKLPWHNVT